MERVMGGVRNAAVSGRMWRMGGSGRWKCERKMGRAVTMGVERGYGGRKRLMIDQEWLREFCETGSEEAFARVVRAYADLVYTTARRQVGNVHLAEDVTQAVFIILAKSARKMGRERVLAGWLIRTTYFAAAH